jgi:hypothetical protein
VATCPNDFLYEKDKICSLIYSLYYFAAEDKKICLPIYACINNFNFEGDKESLDNYTKINRRK